MATPRSAPALTGWYVISLRPSGAHGAVERAAQALGARMLPLSTLVLVPLEAGAALDAALACDWVVATSPAAVEFAHRQRPLAARAGQRWLAVGSGTADALQQVGISGARVPAGRPDSEGLLALTELQAPTGRRVGVITAPGGRGLIAETLGQRGARVHLAEVYRRVAVVPPAVQWEALAALPDTSALLVSSAEAFDGLWGQLAEPARAQLRGRPAVASSPRLAAMLAAQGFAAIVLAQGAAPSRLLEALANDVGEGRFR